MQTLTEIKTLLAAHGLRPNPRLGQNYLHDPNQMRRVVQAAGLGPDECVLEVGAGTGSLSESLLEAGARLVAVELDSRLGPILRRRLEPWQERVRLVLGDVLAHKHALDPEVLRALGAFPSSPPPLPSVPAPLPLPDFKLVANLPYQIASPLLINLAADHPEMTAAVVMCQREVGERLAARPGGRTYGPLSVIIQAMAHVERIASVPPSCFWPPPKVHSAVMRLRRRESPLTQDPHQLLALLHRLFSRRRKQIGTILGRAAPMPAGIEPGQRPEQLSVEQLIALAAWSGQRAP